jgi:hypothetical protein
VALMCVLYQCYRAQQLPPVKPSTWGCQWLWCVKSLWLLSQF